MRDILLSAIIFGSVPAILAKPYIGVLMWSWVSYMNPHRLGWGFAYSLPVAMIVGAATIFAWLISREPKKMPWDTISVLMLLYVLWTGVTTVFSVEPDMSVPKWIQFNKIILMTFLTMIVMRSSGRIDALVWVVVGSIAFFSVKGGLATVLTGGAYRVYGPPDTVIADNNNLAVATLMIVPLMRYLAIASASRWVKAGMYSGIVLSIVSVIGSYSRGALLGLGVLVFFLWWRSRRRLILGALIAVALAFALPYVPQKWTDRMNTIKTYEQDASAVSRLAIWTFALRVATERPLVGGGFNVFEGSKVYERYGPDVARRNVHSIYFEALGFHGFVGLVLFVLMVVAGLRAGRWIRKRCRDHPELAKERVLAEMIQVSLVAYAVAGTFLNLAHYDLFYTLLTVLLLTKFSVASKLAAKQDIARNETSRTGAAGVPAPGVGTAGVAGRHSFLRTDAGQRPHFHTR